ncbi:hypothetical protein Tco_0873421 [Tanacetum coccineum]|uniref:Uncharacterized protein n=1 Tax=Tanacetum coccineum TaxID=301880 RepID=A0ABQ5BIR5_9ASTR
MYCSWVVQEEEGAKKRKLAPRRKDSFAHLNGSFIDFWTEKDLKVIYELVRLENIEDRLLKDLSGCFGEHLMIMFNQVIRLTFGIHSMTRKLSAGIHSSSGVISYIMIVSGLVFQYASGKQSISDESEVLSQMWNLKLETDRKNAHMALEPIKFVRLHWKGRYDIGYIDCADAEVTLIDEDVCKGVINDIIVDGGRRIGYYRVLPPATQEEQFADEKRKESKNNLLWLFKDLSDVFMAWMMPKEIWAAIKTRFGG